MHMFELFKCGSQAIVKLTKDGLQVIFKLTKLHSAIIEHFSMHKNSKLYIRDRRDSHRSRELIQPSARASIVSQSGRCALH